MRVFKRPRSPYYYFDFDLGGTTHVKSTRLKNERQALDYASAYRLKLIKRQVGIIEEEKPRLPTFQEFQAPFDAWIDAQHAGKPGTIKFYKSNYQKLLEFEPMRDLALDRIDYRPQLRHHAGRDAEPRKRLRHDPQGSRRRRQLGRPHHQAWAQEAGPQ